MKKKSIKKVIIFVLLFIAIIAVIINKYKYKAPKTYQVSDVSQAVYLTKHFNRNCNSEFQYVANNESDIVYVNGDSLFRLSDNRVIFDKVQVLEMIYTDMYLYVLDHDNVLHIIDIEKSEKYEINNVVAIEYGDEKLYLSTEKDANIYYVYENSLIKDGIPVNFDQMEIEDKQKNMKNFTYDNQGNCYWVNCDRKEVSVCKKKVEEPSSEKTGIPLDDDYFVSINNLSINGDQIYLLYKVRANQSKYNEAQNMTYCDGILSLDFKKEKSKKVYETANNLTRIIGFDSEKNAVYVYDVDKYQINELNLDTNQQTNICTLEKKYTSLIFEMSKDVLFVYTDNNDLVQIVEL